MVSRKLAVVSWMLWGLGEAFTPSLQARDSKTMESNHIAEKNWGAQTETIASSEKIGIGAGR